MDQGAIIDYVSKPSPESTSSAQPTGLALASGAPHFAARDVDRPKTGTVSGMLGFARFMLLVAVLVALVGAGTAWAQDAPLSILKEGSFFVGGESRSLAPDNEITVHQMYVQYQIPASVQRQPRPAVVMIHGCCLSAKSWEETPDGRMGWNEYFVRKGHPTYLPDQVTRARSGFDPSIFQQVQKGERPPSDIPNLLVIGHATAWTAFRFGPSFGTAYDDEQFPVEAADEFFKQMIPDLNLMLGPYSGPNPTFDNLADLANQVGGAVLIGHSESGFFPEDAALINPAGIKGMITIEPGGSCTTANPLNVALTPEQIAKLATIPTLILYGDHLSGGFQKSFADCHDVYLPQIEAAGGDITFISLPDMGIYGNSHMLMLDKNNLEIADIIMDWIATHAR